MCHAASTQAGLDMEQLLPAGPASAGDSRDRSTGPACVCWHGCELLAQRVHAGTTMLTPEGGLHMWVCSLGGDASPPQSPFLGGCRSQGTTAPGRVQPCYPSEHHPGAENHEQHWGPPEGPRTPLPAGLSQAASCGFVSGPSARCVTCLLVPRSGSLWGAVRREDLPCVPVFLPWERAASMDLCPILPYWPPSPCPAGTRAR